MPISMGDEVFSYLKRCDITISRIRYYLCNIRSVRCIEATLKVAVFFAIDGVVNV
ncbi:hypothetical protein ANAPRD1_00037 [Anaplasma phagocytophilum]|nr:hypothetical protein ANAPRD1_00037 [Anaplasma phagocytophilum]SCV62836.1 hypothetical protein ANAPH1_00288 [Anaplasma phagocytophilum]